MNKEAKGLATSLQTTTNTRPQMPEASSSRELDRLLPLVLDEGDKEALAQLDNLLAKSSDAREQYARYASTHFLLGIEINPLGLSLKPLIPLADEPATPPPAAEAEACLSEASKAAHQDLKRPSGYHARYRVFGATNWGMKRLPLVSTLAAALVVVVSAAAMGAAVATYAIKGTLWREPGRRYTAEEILAAEKWLSDKRIEQGNRFGQLSIGAGGMWADISPLITEVSLLDSALKQGPLPLQSLNGSAGEGYLLELLPGHGLELLVDAESVKENALVVKRVSSTGVPTGHVHSFSSRDVPPHHHMPDGPWQVGRVGYWADFNESDTPRYYLLCAVNREESCGPLPCDWVYSSFRPHNVRSDLLYLGWDDGGGRSSNSADDGAAEPDVDYDDISTLIRVRSPKDLTLANLRRVALTPERDKTLEVVGSLQEGYSLRVAPGEAVLIRLLAAEDASCKLRLIEEQSREVWWTYQPVDRDPSSQLYSIENRTEEPVDLRLVAAPSRGKGGGNEEPLPHSVYIEATDYTEVGFAGVAAGAASPSIRVHCSWIR